MIGTPARPTTILSAKFTTMNKNRRNVILQAPLGVGCATMNLPRRLRALLTGPEPMVPTTYRSTQRRICPSIRVATDSHTHRLTVF
jgi:hypothetical protein